APAPSTPSTTSGWTSSCRRSSRSSRSPESMSSPTLPIPVPHVEETRFGKWFLRTQTWRVHVLERALADLVRLIPSRQPSYAVVVDVGCGSGYSLPKLAQRFLARELIGVDIDPEMLQVARRE